MESARFAIDSDQKFYLEHLPTLNGLLLNGLTVFVDKDFEKYNDMTLTQYAIAKRKPNTLRFLIDKSKELNINEHDILLPKTSNTRSGLLKLAVEFGSKGFYDNVDNSCLNIIIEEFQSAIKDESKYTEVPLALAIEKKNDEAVKILLDNHANFFSPVKGISTEMNTEEEEDNDNKDKTVIEPFKALSMPITCIFKNNNDTDQLKHIFDTVLSKQSKSIFKQINNLQVGNQSYADFLNNDCNLHEAKEFISSKVSKIREEMKIIDGSSISPEPKPQPQTDKKVKPEKSKEIKCESCKKVQPIGEEFIFVPALRYYLCQKCNKEYESQNE